MCSGAVAFILALAAASTPGMITVETAGRALIAAIVCGVMCWASAERSIASTAEAIDAAIERLQGAANGDLQSGIPPQVHESVPTLARAMDGLFRQLHANLESVQRLAMFDPVTSLPNRTNFRRTAERMLAELSPGNVAVL